MTNLEKLEKWIEEDYQLVHVDEQGIATYVHNDAKESTDENGPKATETNE